MPLHTGNYPDKFKLVKVIPIHKVTPRKISTIYYESNNLQKLEKRLTMCSKLDLIKL